MRLAFLLLLCGLVLLRPPPAAAQLGGGIFTGDPSPSGGDSWVIWTGSTNAVATNYHALNQIQGRSFFSTSFSTLLQNVGAVVGDGGRITIKANRYFRAGYVFDSTVIITNWIVIEGEGNPSTVLVASPTLNGPMIQVGDPVNASGGINRFNSLRFEGANGGANCEGIRFHNCAEPVIDSCEFNGFKRAGVTLTNQATSFWSYVADSWFVVQNGGAGILINNQPSSDNDTELFINNCFFGIGQGSGIEVSNRFLNISIQGSRFKWAAPFSASVKGVHMRQGGNYTITGNRFIDWPLFPSPIYFDDRLAPTNYNSYVSGNFASRYGSNPSTTNVVYIGTNVQGVIAVGNNSPNGTSEHYAATNGPIVGFSTSGLRIGSSNSAPITNIVSATTVIDFGSIGAGGSLTNIFAMPGAVLGSPCFVGVPFAAMNIAGATNMTFSAVVYATDAVSVNVVNNGAAAVDPPSGSFKITVFNF